MRRIQLKTVNLPGQEAVYYGNWLRDIISVPKDPRVGMTLEEMRRLLPIFNKLEGDPIYVLLEEAEWKLVDELVKGYHFPRYTAEIIAFADEIANAQEAKMQVVEESSDEPEAVAE
jgi:hypothetical protein